MVNFKQFVLPLFTVGLSLVYAGDGTPAEPKCTFTETSESSGVYTVANCKPGYYLISNSGVIESIPVGNDVSDVGTLVEVKQGNNSGLTYEEVNGGNPVPGYYLIGDGSSEENYIECKVSGCVLGKYETEIRSCTGNIGKLRKDQILVIGCVKENMQETEEPGFIKFGSSVPAEEGDVVPMYVSAPGTVFGFDASASYYVIKAEANAIKFDSSVNITDDLCVNTKNGEVTGRKEDFCSDKSSGYYINCTNGKCKKIDQSTYKVVENSTNNCKLVINGDSCSVKGGVTCTALNNGYHLVEVTNEDSQTKTNKLVEYTYGESTVCSIVDKPSAGYYRNSYQYNEVIKCDLKGVCSIIDSADIVSSCDNNKVYKVVDNSYEIGLCDGKSVILFRDVVGDILIAGASSTIFSNENPFYYIKMNSNSINVNINSSEVNYKSGGKNYECNKGICKEGATYSIVDNKKGKIECNHENGKKGIYFVNIEGELVSSEKEKGYLIEIDGSTCTVITQPYTNDGYYINQSEDEGSRNLIYCNGGECKLYNMKDEEKKYYLNANSIDKGSKKLIECKNKVCSYKSKIVAGVYYRDSSSSTGLISCTNSVCKSERSENRYTYISGDENNVLIVCSSTECKEQNIENEVDGTIYMNGGSEKGNLPLIKVVTESGNMNYKEVTADGENYLYINGNVPNDNEKVIGSVILCKSKTNCSEIDATSNESVFISRDGKIKYCDEDEGDCASKIGKWIKIDINENDLNKAYVVSGNYEVKKKNGGENGKLIYCYKKTDNSNVCEVTTSYSNYYVNADGGSLIQVKSNVPNIVDPEEISVGYYINSVTGSNPNIIVCGENKSCNNFSEVSMECIEGVIITSRGKFCKKVGGDGENFPSSSTKYILKIGNSKITGLDANNYLFKVDGKSVLLLKTESTDHYLISYSEVTENGITKKIYNNSFVTKVGDDGILYECGSNGCTEIENPEAGTYYSNDDNETVKIYPIIHCKTESDRNNEVKCFAETRGNKTNYCIKEKNLMLCNSCDDKKEDCIKQTPKNGLYLNKSERIIISCENNGCGEYSNANVGYYINQDVNEPLIQCTRSIGKVACTNSTVTDGYYISTGTSSDKLIKCVSNSCQEKSIEDSEETLKKYLWYKSGESGTALIRCEVTNNEVKCNSFAMPNTGYYVNGKGEDINGNYLLLCTFESNSVMCKDYKPSGIITGSKYYINAASYVEGKPLIECTNKECKQVEMLGDQIPQYYVSGANSQLIYCINGNICNDFPVNQNGWYIGNNNKLIRCKSVSGKMSCEEKEPVEGGYYLNSDPYTSFKPIIHESGSLSLKESSTNGWYINADTSATDAESIIRCTSKSVCSYRELRNTQCSVNSAGEFTRYSGKIQWCDGNGNAQNLVESSSEIITPFNRNDVIPGINIPSGSTNNIGYALLKIEKNSIILNTVKDGYYYSDGSLYFCPKSKKGICTYEEIDNGYYIEHNGKVVYKCEKESSSCDPVNNNSCENSNVAINNENVIKLCDGLGGIVEEFLNFKSTNMYALKKLDFPGSNADYIRVEVNKYYVKLLKDIEYPVGMSSSTTGNCKISKNNESTCGVDAYKYPGDTDYGYWEYNNGAYKRIFVAIRNEKNEEVIHKYDCKVGGRCEYKKLNGPSPVDNLLENGVLVIKYSDLTKSPAKDIKENSRHYSSSVDKWILCNKSGYCNYEKEDEKDDTVTPDTSSGELQLTISGTKGTAGIKIKSSTKHSKFISKPRKVLSGLRKRSGDGEEDYEEIIELTHVSYTTLDETRNIFVYVGTKSDDENNYKMITNDALDIGKGYSCNKGKCNEIKREGYYLNTAQIGNNNETPGYHELVNCNSEGECKFVTITETLNFENAVATGADDAIISCNTSSGCQTVAVTAGMGLPKCKENTEKNGPYKEDEKYYNEAGGELTENQYCIYNGVIYGSKEELIKEGINMFDVTSRFIDHSKVNESHIYASLYNCKNVNDILNCSQTYGFIINNNNGYSVCNSEGCKYISNLSSVPTSCEVAGNGGIIKDGSELKFCNNNSALSVTDTSIAYYSININVEGSFPETAFGNKLIIGVRGKVIFTVIEDGFIVINSSNGIVSTVKENNANISNSNNLYECNSKTKNCEYVKNELKSYGYYKTPFSENPVICNGDGCGLCDGNGCKISGNSVKFSEDDKTISYEFRSEFVGLGLGSEDVGFIVVSTNYKKNILLVNNYVLLDEENKKIAEKSSEKLYLCSEKSGKCELQKDEREGKNGPYSGWYVSGDGINKAYKCVSGSCTVVTTLNSSCSNFGDLIFSTKDSLYQICDTKTKPSDLIKLSGTIKTIVPDSNSKNLFPEEQNVILINSNSVLGIGKEGTTKTGAKTEVQTDLVITECTTSTTSPCNTNMKENDYCFGNGVVALKYNDNGSPKCEIQKEIVLLLNGPKIATNIEFGTKMYYCDGNKSCRVTQGYYKKGELWYKCDNVQCKVIKEDYAANDVGDLSGSGELNLMNNGKGGVGNEEHSNYYYIKGSNIFPGAENSESVLIEAGINYFVVFKGEGYYLINGNSNVEDKDPQDLGIENTKSVVARKRDGNGNENKLYLCTSNDVTCKLQEKPGNGYYVNGATAVPNKPEIKNAIIVCSDGSCVIAGSGDDDYFPETIKDKEKKYRSIVFDKTGCDERTIGKLIRDSNRKNVKICTSKTASQGFATNAGIKYYNVTITSGNKFCGISISNAEEKVNDRANILIGIDNKSMVQYSNEGYILYTTSGDILDISKKNTQGNLSLCTEQKYSDDFKTVQCNVVSNILSGWYFSKNVKDNSFISCTTTGTNSAQCTINEAPLVDECSTSGSIVYNDNKFKICETSAKQVVVPVENENDSYMAIMNVEDRSKFPGVTLNNTNIIVSINKYNVTMIKWNSYKIVNKDDKKIIDYAVEGEKYTKPGLLYKCEQDGTCGRVDIPYGNWYLKNNMENFADELIYCKEDKNNEDPSGARCVANISPSVGFYVSANKQKPIIQCIQTGLLLNGILDTENDKVLCYERDMKEGWMLNSRVSVKIGEETIEKDSIYMIKCSEESGCEEEENVSNGWYLNTGYSYDIDVKKNNATEINNYYPMIQCTNSGCSSYKEKINDKCTKGGELIYSSKKYKLCITASDSAKFEEVNGVEYQMVQVANYGDFPDADPSAGGFVLVEITKNEVKHKKFVDNNEHYILKEKKMYKCIGGGCSLITDDGSNEITVLEELSSTLYTASCGNSVCKWTNTYNKEAITFLDDNHKLFTNQNADEQTVDKIKYVYKCKLNSICIELYNGDKGVETKGYFINPKHYDQSSKKQVDTLYHFDRNNGGWEIVKKDTLTKCTPLGYKSICYISYGDEYYYNDISSGKENKVKAGGMCETSNGKFYFSFDEVNTGIDKENCIQLPSDSSVYYYRVEEEVYIVDKMSAYVLTGDKYINTINNNVIVNGNKFVEGIWKEDSLFEEKNIITCNSKACTASAAVKCTYNFQKGKCKLTGSNNSINAGQTCISEDKGKLYVAIEKIANGEGMCVKYDVNDESYYYEDDKDEKGNSVVVKRGEEKERSKEWKYYVINKKMYRTNGEEVNILGEGIYIIDNANYLIVFNENYKLSLGDERYKVYVCNNDGCNVKSKCDNGVNNEYIYDRNGSYDSLGPNVIKCEPEKNTITRIRKEGYYLNKPWNDLIKCYENGKCIEINSEKGMEGYYMNSGNEENIIICKRDGEKFACIEEKLLKCEFDEANSICTSEKDMLRNSYCYYRVDDKILGKIEKLVYVDKFIKAGTEGHCITSNINEYFIKYNDSKFLGHEEHSDLIKISKDSIVSIYEPDIGYYIIDTKEGKGVEEDKEMKKTRLYVCRKNVCEEEKAEDRKIYINKASKEKLIQSKITEYYGIIVESKWEVIKHKCVIDTVNTRLCNIDEDIFIADGDLIYVVDNDDIIVSAVIVNNYDEDNSVVVDGVETEVGKRQKGKVMISKTVPLNEKSFIKCESNSWKECKIIDRETGEIKCNKEVHGGDYMFNEKKDSLIGNRVGYYFYNKNKVGDVEYMFNLTPYNSTVNVTDTEVDDVIVTYVYNYEGESYSKNYLKYQEGYYYNAADVYNDGIVVQSMKVPKKVDPNDQNADTSVVNTMKVVKNKCNSKVRNVCISAEEGKVIKRGSPCVVTEGDYKGMYVAIGEISKSSTTTNCVKFDSGVNTICSYDYMKGTCTNVSDGSPISPKEKCVVVNGMAAGVYEGVSKINGYDEDEREYTNGKCTKVENDEITSYQYIGEGKNENAYVFGELYEKLLLAINENEIKPFDHYLSDNMLLDNPDTTIKRGINYGYFVYDDTKIEGKLDGKLEFSSEVQKAGEAYKCDYIVKTDTETEVKKVTGYSCVLFSNADGYYYVNTYGIYHAQDNESTDYPYGGKVMYGSGNKWKVESSRGYYFFNKSNLPAKTNKVDNSEEDDDIYIKVALGKGKGEVDFNYSGRYLNSAIVVSKKQKAVLIEYEKPENVNYYQDIVADFKISNRLRYCTVKSDGTCTSDDKDVTLGVDDACYYNGKLYIVDVVNEGEDDSKQKTMCYTGSEVLKYKLVNGNLYQLDGLSIQKVSNTGIDYYMLNKNMEKFESKYPEVPDLVIECNEGTCSEKADKIDLDQEVMINNAKKYSYESWTMVKYYNEEKEEKYMDMDLYDKYDKCYCLNNEGQVPKETVEESNECGTYKTVYCNGSHVTINYASTGSNMILKFGENVETDKSIKYNEELDALEYNGEYNINNGRVFKFIGEKLYLLKRRRMEPVTESGIYLMSDGKPFDSTEWTSLRGKQEVCYYSNGKCDDDMIKIYRKHRYNINRAMNELTIIEYDDINDLWRTVREDGLYFFFEDNYSINSEDRRVSYVYEIRDGNVSRVMLTNPGYHIFNDLVVERNTVKMEDGASIFANVEESGNRKCKAIETSKIIGNDEYCYNSKKGLCLVKNEITDSISKETNCMYGEGETYYYMLNGNLYKINRQSYEKINSINSVGLYILDKNNKAFSSTEEEKATVYSCYGIKCTIINDLETQYYYNSANDEVLFYDGERNTWIKKVNEEGGFFFNKFGKPVMEGELIAHIYPNNKMGSRNVNMASLSKNIVIKEVYDRNNDISNNVAVEVPSCEVANGVVVLKEKLNIGDNCMDGKTLVTIRSVSNESKVKHEEEGVEGEVEEQVEVEYKYEVIVPSDDKKEYRYVYDEVDNDIVEINRNVIRNYNVKDNKIEGKFILEKNTGKLVEGEKEVECIVYDCNKEKCTLLSNEKLKEGKRYINEWAKENSKLLRYVGNGKFKLENEVGYYFFDDKVSPVGKDSPTLYAVEVYKKDGEIVQRNLMNNNIVGYFLNKANSNRYMVANNGVYYSKGIEMKTCDVSKVEDGYVCKTSSESETYSAGDYCYKSNVIYLLLEDATNTSDKANCITGTNATPLYIESSEFGKSLNGIDVKDRLVVLTNDAIRVADPGHYIVGEGNVLVNNNNDEEKEVTIYKCTDKVCEDIGDLDENECIIANNGTMFGMDENKKLMKVVKDGIYFFDSNGSVCADEECVLSKIVQIKDGNSEVLEYDELEEGAYINEGNPEVIGVYNNERWSIESSTCVYTEVSGTCKNDDIDLNVGSYCVFEGKMYVIYKVDVENNIRNCLVGNNEKPLYIGNTKKELLMVKEKSLNIIKGNGYYAYSGDTLEALDSEKLVESKLVYCNGKKCGSVVVEVGSYINRAPVTMNIAQFNDTKKSTAKTVSKQCEVDGETCSVAEGELEIGNVCINDNALYIVSNNNVCYKVEKRDITYKLVGEKLYMLNDDAVKQKFDGYYFVDGESHAVNTRKDYSKAGVVAYMCSNKGDCFTLDPVSGRYYPDYTTKRGNKFNVVKYDSSKKSKREGSGYESIDEEGIIKLDDGTYASCEFDNNDEVSCKEIEDVGSYKTNDDEVIVCEKDEEGEVACRRAGKGGYYVIDGKLNRCEAESEDADKLECKDVEKEGYFMANQEGDLYKCEEKSEEKNDEEENVNVSNIFDVLFAEADRIVEDDEEEIDNIIKLRDEQVNNSDSENEDETPTETETETTTTTETTTETTTTEEPTSNEEETESPNEVECVKVECDENEPISINTEEGEVQMYVCKKVKKEEGESEEPQEDEDDVYKWVPNEEQCESGNNVKEGEYYKCEDIDSVDENNIPKPNTEHTSTQNEPTATTGSATTSTTTSASSSSSTGSGSTTTSGKTKTGGGSNSSTTTTETAPVETTTSTTVKTTTTTTTKGGATTTTTQTKDSGALSIMRNIPSLTFYLLLFIFTLLFLN